MDTITTILIVLLVGGGIYLSILAVKRTLKEPTGRTRRQRRRR